MKKQFKLLSAVLGLMAFTGCVNDDIPGLGGTKVDLADKYVLKANVEALDTEDVETRALKDENNTNFTFVEGDALRVYDSDMVQNDAFDFNESYGVFLLPEEKGSIRKKNSEGNLDYAWAVFAEEGALAPTQGWDGDNQYVFVGIGEKGTLTYSKDETKDGTVIYKAALPMLGEVKSLTDKVVVPETSESGSKTAAKSFEVDLKYMTGQARIILDAGVSSTVTSVRARAMKLDASVDPTKFSELMNDADRKDAVKAAIAENYDSEHPFNNINLGEGENDKYNFAVEDDNDRPLSGLFEAVVAYYDENDNYVKGNGYLRPMTTDSKWIETEAKPELTMNLEKGTKDAKQNVVFLPIVPGKYEILLIDYQDNDENWHYIGAIIDKEVKTTTQMTLRVKGAIEKTLTHFGEDNGNDLGLQTLIDTYKESGDVEMNVKFGEDGKGFSEEGKYNVLNVPALSGNVTVNINTTIGDSESEKILYIRGGGGEGKLTLNFTEIETPVKIQSYAGNIEVNVGNAKKTIEAEMTEAGSLAFDEYKSTEEGAGLEISAKEVTLGNVSLKVAPVVTGADVTVTGKCGNSIKNAKNVTLVEKDEREVSVFAVVNATGDVTVGEGAVVNNNLSALGHVKVYGTVKGNVTVGEEETSSLVLKGCSSTTNVTTFGAPVEIDLLAAEVKDDVETGKYTVGTVKNIILKARADIRLLNGEVSTIKKEAPASGDIVEVEDYTADEIDWTDDSNWSTLYSEGVSTVDKVNNIVVDGEGYDQKWIVCTSKWDNVTDDDLVAGDLTNVNSETVYTAYQMAKSTTAMTALHADIDLNNMDYTKEMALISSAMNGYNHTISNLKLTRELDAKKETTNVGLYTTTSKDISNLMLKNVTTDFTGEGVVANVGALVGKTQSGKVTIENVKVISGKLETPGKSHDVGGLIGYVNYETVVKNSPVTLNLVKGYYNLGGIVGNVNGTFTAEESRAEVNFALSFVDSDENVTVDVERKVRKLYGTVGFVIGTISNANKNVTIKAPVGGVGKNTVQANEAALHFGNNYYMASVAGKGNVKYTFNAASGSGHYGAIGYSDALASGLTPDQYNKEEETKVTYLNTTTTGGSAVTLKLKNINTYKEENVNL